MMTSSNGNIFRVTGHLCGEFTGHRWRGALMFSLICAWISGWVNTREGDDLSHRAHYDVTAMSSAFVLLCTINVWLPKQNGKPLFRSLNGWYVRSLLHLRMICMVCLCTMNIYGGHLSYDLYHSLAKVWCDTNKSLSVCHITLPGPRKKWVYIKKSCYQDWIFHACKFLYWQSPTMVDSLGSLVKRTFDQMSYEYRVMICYRWSQYWFE